MRNIIFSFVVLNVIIIISYNTNLKAQPTVQIGTQIWMKQNLSVDKYRNGDPIPLIQEDKKWNLMSTGAWCYYKNQASNGIKYGKLYNLYAVTDSRGLCPAGFHVPTYEDWLTLIEYLGVSGAEKMKSTSGWDDYYGYIGEKYTPAKISGNGTNSTGFEGLPGGHRQTIPAGLQHTTFQGAGGSSSWWSSTLIDKYVSPHAWNIALISDTKSIVQNGSQGGFGYYVRCIKD